MYTRIHVNVVPVAGSSHPRLPAGTPVRPPGTRRLLLLSTVVGLLSCATVAVGNPYFVIESETEWTNAQLSGKIMPMDATEWGDYMLQWNAFIEEGGPYPTHTFNPPQLYVYGGGGGGGADPEDAGLVMAWGSAAGPTPDGSYSSAWRYDYQLDPDLSNSVITITVTAPSASGINVVSFGIQDVNLNVRAWYWNVGGAGPIQYDTPTSITINTSKTGTTAATPTASAYMNNPAFDITQSQWFIVDENANWVGMMGIPPPGQVDPAPWNYWHNLIVLPFQGYVKWAQPPTFNDLSPFPECFWGWDELSFYGGLQIVADDWPCQDSRPITDIHWWGSYQGWGQESPPPVAPDRFHIGIWTDVAAGDPQNPFPWSHPGDLIQEWWVQRSDLYEHYVGCDYHDDFPNLRDACFRYDFFIPEAEWFYQDPNTNNVYWISISADYGAGYPQYAWGWKTREHMFNDDAVRIFYPTAPIAGVDQFLDGEPIEDLAGNTWDMAFVLTAKTIAPTKLKWDQPPDPIVPNNVYYGWNEYSVWDDSGLMMGRVAADDWYCDTSDPVTKIRWWGSFIGWRGTDPPTDMPDHFHINVWTDQMCNDPVIYGDFSCPDTVIHEIVCYNFTVTWVGWDYNPATGDYESCFLFEQDLLPSEYFYQDPIANQIYWLSISAHYTLGTLPSNPWGWKTLPRDPLSQAPDDAVRIFDPMAPTLGSVYVNGEPIEYPWGSSWDLAFELIATPQAVTVTKWEQLPDVTIGPLGWTGIDVNATRTDLAQTFILADDFECTLTGPLTDIHVWGSWYHDLTPYNEIPPTSVVFTLSIHEDIPAGAGGLPYSTPGALLWEKTFYPGDFNVFAYAQNIQEGWLNPPANYEPFADTVCWQYDFFIAPADAFIQQGTPTNPVIYWLDVQAYQMGGDVYFGWKTSLDHWNDDAVWGTGIEPYLGPWYDLYYPPNHAMYPDSIDLAFRITGEAEQQPYVKWSQPPQPYNPDDGYNGWNELSMYYGPQIGADDWFCDTEFPVTDLHWWGSFLGWGSTTPPQLPDAFHIGIWTDAAQPCVAPSYGNYSCPDTLIHEIYCTDFTWEFVGWDWDPRDPAPAAGIAPEACFRFDQYLDQTDWFYQNPGDNIYWISIAAVYATGTPNYAWGWKTRPRDPLSLAPDDAIAFWDPLAPVLGSQYLGAGGPQYYPNPIPADSWDYAFQLTTLDCDLPGDMNMDGVVNGDDIQCFVDCLTNGFGASSGTCNCACADMDGDGYLTMADVPLFVTALLTKP